MCCGGGSSRVSSEYDPQVGEAAKLNAETAKEGLDFTKDYFNNTLTPLQRSAEERASRYEGMSTDAYNRNKEREILFDTRYRQLGIPAEDRYFKMVSDYSAPEEQERQARLAQGDIINAAAVQRANLQRQLASQGVDPTSGAAVAAQTDASLMTAAAQAAASNRARDAAKALGMTLTSDAANYGRGMPSGVLSFGNAAAGNAAQGFAYGNSPMASAQASGGFVQQGYRGANAAYGQNLQTFGSLANTDRQVQGQMESANAAGAGQALGQSIGLGLAAYAAFSDRRLKENVEKVGSLKNGLPVYRFNYRGEDTPQIGLMAQDVKKVHPEAIINDKSGYMKVDYAQAVRPVED
jgi:hypothetical protein